MSEATVAQQSFPLRRLIITWRTVVHLQRRGLPVHGGNVGNELNIYMMFPYSSSERQICRGTGGGSARQGELGAGSRRTAAYAFDTHYWELQRRTIGAQTAFLLIESIALFCSRIRNSKFLPTVFSIGRNSRCRFAKDHLKDRAKQRYLREDLRVHGAHLPATYNLIGHCVASYNR